MFRCASVLTARPVKVGVGVLKCREITGEFHFMAGELEALDDG